MEIHDLEAIIQRFSAGERSPELLAPLNLAAWEGFHDPWEPWPGPIAAEAGPLPAVCPAGPGDPPAPLHRPGGLTPHLLEQVTSYLDLLGWDYDLDLNFEFRFTPPLPGLAGQDLTVCLCGGGPSSSRLWLHMTSGHPLAEPAWTAARAFCARWNRDHQGFRARLEWPPAGSGPDRAGTLSLHRVLPLGADTTLATVAAFLDESLDQAGDFWLRARAGLLP